MNYTIKVDRNRKIFIQFKDTDTYMYAGADMTTAFMIRDILNDIDKNLDQVYSTNTGFFIKTKSMSNARPLTMWNLSTNPEFNSDEVVRPYDWRFQDEAGQFDFKQKDWIAPSLPILKEIFRTTRPMQMVKRPDTNLCSKVWYETYSACLKAGCTPATAIAEANDATDIFINKCTQKTTI